MRITRLNRYTLFEGKFQSYKVDRYLVKAAFVISLLIFAVGVVENRGFDAKLHILCRGPEACVNPYYQEQGFAPDPMTSQELSNEQLERWHVPLSIRSVKMLAPGYEINKPGFWTIHGLEIIGVVFAVVFVINHWLYNREFSFYILWRAG